MSGFRRGMIANATASDPMLKVPLTFTAEEAGATIQIVGDASGNLPDSFPGLYYRMGTSGDWQPYDEVMTPGITLTDIGDSCQFWNSNDYWFQDLETEFGGEYAVFYLMKKIAASGNIMSLLNWREDVPGGSFYTLFAQGGCTLTKAPLLPATELGIACYFGMFEYNQYLTEIRVHFTSWSDATDWWVYRVASTGTFYKPSALPEEYGESRIPEGWTVVNID